MPHSTDLKSFHTKTVVIDGKTQLSNMSSILVINKPVNQYLLSAFESDFTLCSVHFKGQITPHPPRLCMCKAT